jgi:hypothetical protein
MEPTYGIRVSDGRVFWTAYTARTACMDAEVFARYLDRAKHVDAIDRDGQVYARWQGQLTPPRPVDPSVS